MTMESPHEPDRQRELATIVPLLPILYEATEGATSKASQYFEVDANIDPLRRFSPNLYANLVRYHAGEFLRDKGQVLEDFEREEMLNDGLCFAYQGRRYRMWKSEGELPPLPGSSQAKRDFFNQMVGQPRLFRLEDETVIELNLILLWIADARHRLKELRLVCPKYSSVDGLKVGYWWNLLLDHPATMHAPVSAPPEPPKDLPITIRETEIGREEESS
jgi:hypothetical protein